MKNKSLALLSIVAIALMVGCSPQDGNKTVADLEKENAELKKIAALKEENRQLKALVLQDDNQANVGPGKEKAEQINKKIDAAFRLCDQETADGFGIPPEIVSKAIGQTPTSTEKQGKFVVETYVFSSNAEGPYLTVIYQHGGLVYMGQNVPYDKNKRYGTDSFNVSKKSKPIDPGNQPAATLSVPDLSKDGPVLMRHANGQKSSEGTYKNYKRDGIWIEWDKDGKKIWEATYKDGELIKEEKFE